MKTGTLTTMLWSMLVSAFVAAPLQAEDSYYLPSSRDICCNLGNFKVGAEWLYWKPTQENLTIGYRHELSDATMPSLLKQHAIHPDFKYESGYRLNLGYELPCDEWELEAIYTYLPGQSHAKANVGSVNDGIALNPQDFPLFANMSASVLGNLSAEWKLSFSNVDLDVARTFFFCENFRFRPHIGFRACWMEQRYHFHSTLLADEGAVALPVSGKLDETMTAYGIEGGFWGNWRIGGGFSLLGHVGGSVMYAKFNVHQKVVESSVVEDVETPFAIFHERNRLFAGTPTLDYFLGVQYADCFGDMVVSARFGWEQFILFGAGQFGRGGNLSAQGLTMGLDVIF